MTEAYMRVPLAERLRDTCNGGVSLPLAGKILTRLALTSINEVCEEDAEAARELERLAMIDALDGRNPAVVGDWGLDRTCYASVSWYVEVAFRMRDATSNPDSRQRLARVTNRAMRHLANVFGEMMSALTENDLVEPTRPLGMRCAGVCGLEEWVERYGSATALRALRRRERPDTKALLAGFLCLPTKRVVGATAGLVGAVPDVGPGEADRFRRFMSHLLEGGPQDGWVMLCLRTALNGDCDLRLTDALRPVLVTPFAELWELGVLRDTAKSAGAASGSPCPELERRLAAVASS